MCHLTAATEYRDQTLSSAQRTAAVALLHTIRAEKALFVCIIPSLFLYQIPTRLADTQFLAFAASRRVAVFMGPAATNAVRHASNVQMSIEFAALYQRQRGVAILIIRVMQAAQYGCPIRPNFRKCRICFPEIRQTKAPCDDTLHDAPIQLPYIIVILWIQSRLHQHAVPVAEDLPGQPPRAIEIVVDFIIDCEEYHTHAVTHIGLTAGPPSAVE